MPSLKARATIAFPKIDSYLDAIIESFAAHDMALYPDGDGHAIKSPFGTAHLLPRRGVLELCVEAADPAAFNRLKHELTGLIEFVAHAENLAITWTGDRPGVALPPDLRVLAVRKVRDLTPRMRRISFEGDDLARYAVPDQIHCRLLFQEKGVAEHQWPQLDDNGRIVWPDAGKLASRIFTIRRIDPVAGTLDIDFVLHGGTGPGTSWAMAAAPRDVVGILGPAAHGPKPANWYLLAGDETGLPGIGRILEGLPADAKGVALIEVADIPEEQAIDRPSGVEVRWLHRDGAAPGTTMLLADALRALVFPAGRDALFCWIGAEFSAFRDMRVYLRSGIGLPASRVIAFSHWRRGMSEEDIVEAGASAAFADPI